MNLKNKYQRLIKENNAIIAANFYNLETLKGLLSVASENNISLLLQLSKSSIKAISLGINKVEC